MSRCGLTAKSHRTGAIKHHVTRTTEKQIYEDEWAVKRVAIKIDLSTSQVFF